jgi:hypothetical protein
LCVGHRDMSPLRGARQGFGPVSTVAYPESEIPEVRVQRPRFVVLRHP